LSKTLVIVESPAKAKTISKFLGKKYTVKSSVGHVRDLPKSQLGVNVEKGFEPKYITIRGKGGHIKELKNIVKKVKQVLLASDPDREGEAIAWHLQELLNICADRPCRIEFNEITKEAIHNAVNHPRPIDFNLVNAQQARRILDRLVGYNLSPLLWRKVKKGLSAGRVQSVAVRLVCDREEEIQGFVPEEYWTITGSFSKIGGEIFQARLYKHRERKVEVHSQAEAEKVINDLQRANYVVTKVSRQEKKRHSAPPFITSSLQQEAYRKLNFTARKTMMVAQQLYEGLELGKEGTSGLITYIRTDSTRVSTGAREEAAAFVSERFGVQYWPKKVRTVAEKGRIQDAHEAIRPTSIYREPELIKQYLTPDQYKLYRLVWARFLASQMGPAVFDVTTVDIKGGNYLFRATGSVMRFPGFTKVYIEGRDNNEEKEENGLLPELQQGDALEMHSLNPAQHFTQPPPRYTEASLIRVMEEKGIGRPSTYAPVLETVIKRGYVVREKKQLYPTELGIIVIDLLKKYFPDIINVEFTAGMEEQLDNIEEGVLNWVQVLEDFYYPFDLTLKKAEEEISQVQLTDEVTEEVCELCGRKMVVKVGRYGKFLACPGFPECRNARPLVESIGVPCPRCDGDLVARRSKKGRKFYGCSRYPNCNFMSWDQPSPAKCPDCGGLMVEKKGKAHTGLLYCINKSCKSRQPARKKKTAGKHSVREGKVDHPVEMTARS